MATGATFTVIFTWAISGKPTPSVTRTSNMNTPGPSSSSVGHVNTPVLGWIVASSGGGGEAGKLHVKNCGGTSGSTAVALNVAVSPSVTVNGGIGSMIGSSLTGTTVIATVAVLLFAIPSVALYVNESMPLKSWFGV